MHLGADEYFVLGDNSLISGDARYWHEPIDLPADGNLHVPAGRVPERFMLGRAFFVYWPAGLPSGRDGTGPGAEFRGHAVHSVKRFSHRWGTDEHRLEMHS